jgi:hypothetical protein
MSFPNKPRVAARELLPAAAFAQQAQESSPTDPNAPVLASGYVSAFKDYRPSTITPKSKESFV